MKTGRFLHDLGRFQEEYERTLVQRWDQTQISVMVLGPNTAKRTLEARLRKSIIEACKAYATTLKGEHEQLIKIHRQIIGPGHNLCSMERDIAYHNVDAVVIIPASAGSLVEFGMFALEDAICEKTLVLFNDKYAQEQKPSFMQRGPKLAYQARGSLVEFVNYGKKELVLEKVHQFLQSRKALKYDRSR